MEFSPPSKLSNISLHCREFPIYTYIHAHTHTHTCTSEWGKFLSKKKDNWNVFISLPSVPQYKYHTVQCVVPTSGPMGYWLVEPPALATYTPSCVCDHNHCLTVSQSSVQGGFTALYAASQEGHLRVVEMLLKANADVNIKTKVRAVSSCYSVTMI